MPESPYDVLVEAFREAKDQMREATRVVKADIVAPADPNAVKQTPQERRQIYQDMLDNPALLESEFLRLKDRYKLSDARPIPRRLVDFIRHNSREVK